jgi:hypothetical protein
MFSSRGREKDSRNGRGRKTSLGTIPFSDELLFKFQNEDRRIVKS